MIALRPALTTALLTLALAAVSPSVRADRNNHNSNHNDNRRDRAAEFSAPPRALQPRGDVGSSLRTIDSSNDWRNRTEFNRVQDQRYEHYPSTNFNDRNGFHRRGGERVDDDDRRNDAIDQRLYDDRRDDSGYHRRGGQRPVNDVIREVQSRYGGQVIGVQNSEGGSMYRVRVLQHDGRVKNVLVPAQ